MEASTTMKKLTRSQNSIPMPIMKSAKAIVIIPGSVRFGLFLGGRVGEGVASIKKADGSGSYPVFL